VPNRSHYVHTFFSFNHHFALQNQSYSVMLLDGIASIENIQRQSPNATVTLAYLGSTSKQGLDHFRLLKAGPSISKQFVPQLEFDAPDSQTFGLPFSARTFAMNAPIHVHTTSQASHRQYFQTLMKYISELGLIRPSFSPLFQYWPRLWW
jgi:hypothetical protein